MDLSCRYTSRIPSILLVYAITLRILPYMCRDATKGTLRRESQN